MRITEQIKDAVSAEDYISGLITVRNGRAICPFHEEKTASLQVHRDYFKCFGCGTGGDVITFAVQYHQISIREAVRLLAIEAGISLRKQDHPRPYDAAKTERIRNESVEWRRLTRLQMVNSEDYETSYPFIQDLDEMTKKEVMDAYSEQRTPEQAAFLRESARLHAIPTLESIVFEFLAWSRKPWNQ